MASTATTMLVLASIVTVSPGDMPGAEVQSRFEAACTKGRWEASCPKLRGRLEFLLYKNLYQLNQMHLPINRTVVRAAAAARFPYLAYLGLGRLGKLQSAEEKAIVTAALEHPSPAVRARAKGILDKSGDTLREELGRWWLPRGADMLPETKPDMEAYNLPGLNGPQFRYRYMASSEGRAVFTTKLSPEQALDLVVKGKPVITGETLVAAQAATQREQARQDEMVARAQNPDGDMEEILDVQKQMMEAMQRGDIKTMQQLAKRLQALSKPVVQQAESDSQRRQEGEPDRQLIDSTAGVKPIAEYSTEPAQVRYVKLRTEPDGKQFYAAAAYDDAWGETAVVVVY